MIDSTGNTLEAGGFPMLWWPQYSGPIINFPLRGVRSGWGEYEGGIVETTWDFFSLAGWEPPDGQDLTFDIDGYTERGIGGGIDWELETADNSMALDLYGIKDSGTQRTDTGISMEVPKDYRYAALWQQTIKLSESWMFQGQLSYMSDATYISAWREDDYRDRREYESSLYLKNESRNTAFTVLGKYTLNNFISNSWLIASQGYQVNKLPELSYMRFGDSLFGDMLTWSSQYNASRMQIVIPEGTPANSGLRASTFTNPDGSAFGANEPIKNAAQYQGLRSSWVNRLSTRQNISMPLQWGAFNITPFAMGQIVSYFEDDTTGGAEESKHQYYGSGGVRINTVLQRVFNDVNSDLFDLHRLRHLIEPYFMAWYSTSNYDILDTPIYDPLFDNLSTGGVVRVGLRNTLQTQRGGPGRWYDVDWLTLDASLVMSTESEENRFPTPQFFDWEPGYSQLGNFAQGSYTLAVQRQPRVRRRRHLGSRSRTLHAGRHGHRVDTQSTVLHLRRVPVHQRHGHQAARLRRQLRDLRQVRRRGHSTMGLRPRGLPIDVQASVVRAFPDFDFIFYVSYDQVRGETRVGAQLGQVNY